MDYKAKKAVSIIVIIGLIIFFGWKYLFGNVVSVENIIEDAGPLRYAVIMLDEPISMMRKEKAYTVTTQSVRAADFEIGYSGMMAKSAPARIKKLGGEVPKGQLIYSSKNASGEVYIYSTGISWRVFYVQDEILTQMDIAKAEEQEGIINIQHGDGNIYLHCTERQGNRRIARVDLENMQSAEDLIFKDKNDYAIIQKYDAERGKIIVIAEDGKSIYFIDAVTNETTKVEFARQVMDVFASNGGYIAVEGNFMSRITLHYLDENMNRTDETAVDIPATESKEPNQGKSSSFAAIDGDILYTLVCENERAAICAIDINNQELLQISSIKIRNNYRITDCRFLDAAGMAPIE